MTDAADPSAPPSQPGLCADLAAGRWPSPGAPDRVPVARERWLDAADAAGEGAFARAMLAEPAAAALLDALFGNSPFLTDCLIRDVVHARTLLTRGPDGTFAELIGQLNDRLAADPGTDAVMRALRQAKRRAALAIAVADIGGLWSLDLVTAALSRLAAAALDVAVGHLLADALRRRTPAIGPDDLPGLRGGLIVLGMGKLGAEELNYSSDIDLIVLFDAERVPAAVTVALGDRAASDFYVRLTRGVIRMMAERTADGYVFRTDLRLRPDPASTPLVLSRRAAEAYYESVGQNWERAALTKARPVAGDLAAGRDFLAYLRPFLWRRHLDFAAIADIHSIKRQIHAARGGGAIAVRGHNVKLGRGGIREIEFFAQTQQLIWGGRLPSLRQARTTDALAALAMAGRIEPEVAMVLTRAYRFLRTVEHRLQMIDDQQTHTLPADPESFAHLARFLDFPDAAGFEAALMEQLAVVQSRYAELFEEAPPLAGPGALVFTGKDDDPETLATLAGMGFRDARAVSAGVRGWHHGRLRATRSPRARELLTELCPTLLAALARTADPDGAFVRFDRFLGNLPAGVQLFSLFYARPQMLGLVARIMGTAPSLADRLARQPGLLDGLLSDSLAATLPDTAALEQDLAQVLASARDLQDVLDLTRRWAGDRRFQVGVQLLDGQADMAAAARILSDIADAVIRRLLQAIVEQFRTQYGSIPGGAFAVLALGKLGACEMTPTSDLDLVFVYDAPGPLEPSDGPQPLPASVYFPRLGQRLISALTALTAEGELYQVDMRLRPTGNKGPVAVALEGFRHYQQNEAWTWEHMALTRARLVAAAPESFGTAVDRAAAEALQRPREPGRLWADVTDMRRRLAREHGVAPPFDVKHRPGGLLDLDFLVQGLMLEHAASHPGLGRGGAATLLPRLADAGLVPAADAAALVAAARLFSTVQGLLRLTTGGDFDPDAAPEELKRLLVRATATVDFATLAETISGAAAVVAEAYRRIAEARAAPAPQETRS